MPRTPNARRHVQSARAALRRIDRTLAVLAALVQRSGGGRDPAPEPARKLKLSPERRRALKLQGSYLGYMRQLKPAQKARVRAAKQARGMRAAIALARRLAGA